MFVRLARYEVPEERLTEAVAAFEDAARELEGEDGLRGGYILRDADSGGIVSITLWDNRLALETSEVRAARLRQGAMQQVEGSVASVQCLEVAVDIAATQTAPVDVQ